MEVTSISHDPIALAVVGGGAARSFSMASSSHSFRTISDTLYQNKILAVVREYICNAVDAHIEYGCFEKPIEITLTKSEFSVSDFGAAISDEKMPDVFCTVFQSFKKHDDRQTGGFGLGTKAGFAVTDNFTVTCHHEGVCSVYAMHIGSDDSDGMPVLQLMTSYPTDRHGLTVTIPINPKDHSRFDAEIKTVVHDGGINAILNGKILPTIDYTEIKKLGFGIIKSMDRNIKVLLGNVTYNLACDDVFANEYDQIRKNFYREDYCLVIHVKPGEVRPTPSRESLSYNRQSLINIQKRLQEITEGIYLHPKKDLEAAIGVEIVGQRIKRWELARFVDRYSSLKFDQPKDLHGIEGLRKFIAYRTLINDSVASRCVARAAFKLFQNKRHYLSVLSNIESQHSLNMRAENRKYMLKRLARFMSAAGLTGKILFKENVSKIRPLRRSASYAHLNNKFVIGLNQSSMIHRENDYWTYSFCTTKPSMSDHDMVRLHLLAKRYDIDLIICKRPVLVKKKPAPLIVKVENKINGHLKFSTGYLYTDSSAYLIEKPDQYIGIKRNNKNVLVMPSCSFTDRCIKTLFPNTAIIISAADLEKMRLENIPRFEDRLLVALTKQAKSNSNIQSILAYFAVLKSKRYMSNIKPPAYRDSGHYETGRFLRDVIGSGNITLIHAVFDLKFRLTTNLQNEFDLWRLALEYFEQVKNLEIVSLTAEEGDNFIKARLKFESLLTKTIKTKKTVINNMESFRWVENLLTRFSFQDSPGKTDWHVQLFQNERKYYAATMAKSPVIEKDDTNG